MNIIHLDSSQNDMQAIIAQVLANAEPTVVDSGAGKSVVVMPLDDFNAWQETAYLLKNPANAEHLSRSISEAQAGNSMPHSLDENGALDEE